MDNEIKDDLKNLNKDNLKDFFKEIIDESRNSTEKKTQAILDLLNSIKDETEQRIAKSNIKNILININLNL